MDATTDSTASAGAPTVPRSSEEALGLIWVFPQQRFTPFQDREVVLGRGKECDVQIPGVLASRRHARLEHRNGVSLIGDLQSKNGTRVNGVRIAECQLAEQDVVCLGEWVAVVGRARGEAGSAGPYELHEGLFGGVSLAEAFDRLRGVAPSDLSVVLVGETGTGKDLFARALHSLSGRGGPLVAINCAAVPEQLAEAELFGYRRGAFTGAIQDALGHFRSAQEGTLFLDEVVELDPSVQAKLLRALESRAVTPLGQSRPVPADVRVVCAAQSPLAAAVEQGRFRADLYARLRGLELSLPPLRQRREEIVPHFLRFLYGETGGEPLSVAPEAIELLCLYDWPMNVRQLSQVARQVALLRGSAKRLDVTHLPSEISDHCDSSEMPGEGAADLQDNQAALRSEAEGRPSRAEQRWHALRRRDDIELERLLSALRRAHGNVTLAARRLGVSRQRAYRIISAVPGLDLAALRETSDGSPTRKPGN
jgi:DNA-binding NtrC family response regulator